MDKVDHLAMMFNTRTSGKKYENYIVNAIYQRIGEPELIPVTQQYVHSAEQAGKYFFIDLYFPQINYGVEIDEAQHETKEHKQSDKERALDILSAVDCKLGRVSVTDGKEVVPLETLNRYIDDQVQIIRDMIASLDAPLVWITDDEKKRSVIKRGYFDASDDVMYDNILEIRKMIGQEPKVSRRCCVKLNDDYMLWVPFLAKSTPHGGLETLNGWENILSEDGNVIKEKSPIGIKEYTVKYNADLKRVVFIHMKDMYGRESRKFLGVYRYVGKENGYKRYERISTRIEISKLK